MVTGRAGRTRRVVLICALIAIMNAGQAVAQTTWSLPAPWSAQDIGNPAVAGSASVDQGTFTINAGGTDIWGQSDQFHYVVVAARRHL